MPSALSKSIVIAEPKAADDAIGKAEPVIPPPVGSALPPTEIADGKLSPVPFPVAGDCMYWNPSSLPNSRESDLLASTIWVSSKI